MKMLSQYQCNMSQNKQNVISENKLVFVDLFKGTGSMARHAHIIGYFKKIITLDVDESCEPDIVADIRNASELEKTLSEYQSKGYVIIMHASPPCQQFSRMNTIKSKKGDTDVSESIELVKASINIMSKYSDIWILENPATGSLWETDYAKETFKYVHRFDYCAYGGIIQKPTAFAFSREDIYKAIQAKQCPGRSICDSCFRDPDSGYIGHVNWDNVKYNDRISIPPQLCIRLLTHLISFAHVITNELNLVLFNIHQNKESSPAPSTSIIPLSHNDPSRSTHPIKPVSSTSPKKRRFTEQNNARPHLQYDIQPKEIVIFSSNDDQYRFSPLNIMTTEDIEYKDHKQTSKKFAMAFYVIEHMGYVKSNDSNVEYYVVRGYRYRGICEKLKLLDMLNTETIAISSNNVLSILTLSEQDNYQMFKLTKAKINKIVDMLTN